MTRQTDWGGSLGPDQGLSRADAILSVAARDIRNIEVLATVLGGEVVYGSLDR